MRGARRSVLVTGGTGYLGSAIVRQLIDSGVHVQVLARSARSAGAGAGAAPLRHVADLTDERSIQRAFRDAARAAGSSGAELDVIHCAALISYRSRDAAELRRVNVEGTRIVLEAARAVDVRRFCHVSSVAAIGAAPDADTCLDDEAPLGRYELGCEYGATKRDAEALVLAQASRLDVVVASPCAIFGWSPLGSNTLEFLRFLARGTGAGALLARVAPPGAISVVGRDDAALGILLALERGRRAVRYLLVESSWELVDLLALAACALERPGPSRRVPRTLWAPVVAAAALVDRIRPLERATPETLRVLGLRFSFRSTLARNELGWSPRPFAEVLAETIRGLPAVEARSVVGAG